MAEPSAAPSAKRAVAAAERTVGCVGEPDQVGAITSRFIATTSSSWSPGTGTRAGAGTDWVAIGAGGVGVASGGVVVGTASAPVGSDWTAVVGVASVASGGVCAATVSVAAGAASTAVGTDD